MYCKKCKIKMTEQKRSFHKKRKWICPLCGRARMEVPQKKLKAKNFNRDY